MKHLNQEDHHLGSKVHWISHYIHCKQNKLLEPYGITSRQARILVFLIHNPNDSLTQKDIQQRFSRAGSSITSILNTLEKHGFIERRADEHDARKKCIHVTQAGKDLDKIMFDSICQLEDDIRNAIDPEEYQTAESALKKVITHLLEKENKQ